MQYLKKKPETAVLLLLLGLVVLAGIALVSAALVFGGNLLANVLYGVLDPRMRTREGRA